MINDIPSNEFHFAGHDTFHLRYTWLPKAADYINKNPNGVSFSAYDKVMIDLGIGKNMASALRHWSESSQLFEKNPETKNHQFTNLGMNSFNWIHSLNEWKAIGFYII